MNFSKKQLVKVIACGIGKLLIISYLFFNSIWLSIVMSPYMFYYIKKEEKVYMDSQKIKFKIEFFEALESTVAYIRSGVSIEGAFAKVMTDIELLYGKQSLVYLEFESINAKLSLDIGIEEAIKDVADKVEIKEIHEFVELFAISKRRDGNIIYVTQSMCDYIKNEIELERQVRLSINSVIQELSIMKLMPLAILAYLRLCSKEYMNVVYENVTGYIVMVVILVIYVVALWISHKMELIVLKMR